MKICVTGANGFIGSLLCQRLIQHRHVVHALIRKTSDHTLLQPLQHTKKLKLFYGDIRDAASILKAMKGCSIVFHIAARASDWGTWKQFKEINIDGTRRVFECALQCNVQRIIYTSTVAVYGCPNTINGTEDMPQIKRPAQKYIVTKRAAELLVHEFIKRGADIVTLRPSAVFGPNDRTFFLRLCVALEKGKYGSINGGRQLFAPIYSENLIDAYIAAMKKKNLTTRVYHLSNAGIITWKEFNQYTADLLGVPMPKISVAAPVAMTAAVLLELIWKCVGAKEPPLLTRYRILMTQHDFHLDTSRAYKELGWKPRISTKEGIRRSVQWYTTIKKEQRDFIKKFGG